MMFPKVLPSAFTSLHVFTVPVSQVGTGHTVATLADASELPGVTVAQVNYSTVTDGEVGNGNKHPTLTHARL